MADHLDAWGRTTLAASDLWERLYQSVDIAALALTDDAEARQHNACCRRFDKPDKLLTLGHPPLACTPEAEHARRAATWEIAPAYVGMAMRPYLLATCRTAAERQRVADEMDLFEARGLDDLLRMMVTLVDHFRRNKVVWGVGRGSSCASYVLFLIGVHRIDSLKYGLDIREFLK